MECLMLEHVRSRLGVHPTSYGECKDGSRIHTESSIQVAKLSEMMQSGLNERHSRMFEPKMLDQSAKRSPHLNVVY